VLRRERPQLVHREDHRADREQRAADVRRRVLGDAAADRLAEIGGARAVGSAEALVAGLVDHAVLTPKQLERLTRQIAEAKAAKGPKAGQEKKR
jgi:enoyl-CoA hydratase/carnithine racemase